MRRRKENTYRCFTVSCYRWRRVCIGGRYAGVYYCASFECDPIDVENVYLEKEDVTADNGMMVLGYVDEKTPMWTFTGNIVYAEYIRGIVTSALLSGSIGGIIILGFYVRKDRKIRI